MILNKGFFQSTAGDWRCKLEQIVATMREMSLQDDPQAMVQVFGKRLKQYQQTDGFVSLSRRGLESPKYRITRSSRWEAPVDPWKEKDRLPLLEGGLMGELLYGDAPRIIDDLDLHLAADDPGRAYFEGNRSLIAIPHYDKGIAQNMVLMLRKEPRAFDPEQFPDWVWMSSLFGRATQTLVLAGEVKKAYEVVDRELKLVADIQRSLLPKTIPAIPGLDLAAHYQTSQWAGGDYYDFFPRPDGKWGLLIADVSGHGTPAAVLMAVTHSLAHGFPGPHDPPSALLAKVNHQLATLYTADNESFVTAFYGIYDPATRRLSYSCAGHNPPRLMRCSRGVVESLEDGRGLPLGLFEDGVYEDSTIELAPGDQITFYTDGITEAAGPDGSMYGLDRLDAIISRCGGDAAGLVADILADVLAFADGVPPADDQTLLGMVVS